MSLEIRRQVFTYCGGWVFLGFLTAVVGFKAEEPQPVPLWVWRALGVGGLLMMVACAGVAWRAEWGRMSMIAALAILGTGYCALFAYGVIQGRFNPFLALLGGGIWGCGQGTVFFSSARLREYFRTPGGGWR